MKFEEAMRVMRDGGVVRRKSEERETVITPHGEGEGPDEALSIHDLLATDWKLA